MDAQAILDRYVHDVARQLPVKKRDDVAFELRGLLSEELQSKADAAGRAPDPEMAVALVRGFGRPAEVAARYHTPFTIIEPSDTRGYVLAALAGAAVIAVLDAPGPDAGLRSVGGPRAAEVAFLGWLGFLALAFAVKGWLWRRRPDLGAWTPRPLADPDDAGRIRNVIVAVLAVLALAVYVAPEAALALLPEGIVDPAVFAYTDDFRSPLRMSWLIGILGLYAILHVIVAVAGRWQRWTRWADIVLTLQVGIQLGWHMRYGNVFVNPTTETLVRPGIAVLVALIVVYAAVQAYLEWTRVRPSPALEGATATR